MNLLCDLVDYFFGRHIHAAMSVSGSGGGAVLIGGRDGFEPLCVSIILIVANVHSCVLFSFIVRKRRQRRQGRKGRKGPNQQEGSSISLI